VFLLLQFCTYGQLLELKLLAFLSGTLHILLFISAYCAYLLVAVVECIVFQNISYYHHIN